MGITGFTARFRRDESGSTVIWTGLALSIIIGIGALAVDMGDMYVKRAELQLTADASALAAAKVLPDQAAAVTAAQAYAVKNMGASENGTVLASNDVVAGYWDSSAKVFTPSGSPVNAVRVVTRRSDTNGNPVKTYFANAMGISAINISASAIATKPAGKACIIALNPTAQKAFYLQGNAAVHTSGCEIQVNSCNATGALWAQGETIVQIIGDDAKSTTNVCGDVYQQGPVFFSPPPNENTGDQVPDPFSYVSGPNPNLWNDSDHCDYNNFSASGDVDLLPGVYCGGIAITGGGTATFAGSGGNLTLPPGMYVIKNGPLSIAGTTTVVGNGVTFFMTGPNAYTDFKGTADIGLSAPTTGDFAGFIFIGDRNHPSSTPHLMRGTPMGGYNGYIYLPKAIVEMDGTANGTTGKLDCTVAVADQFKFLGTPNFEAMKTCSDFNNPLTNRVVLAN